MSYGNPEARTKYENEATSAIHWVERQIFEYFEHKYGYRPGLRVDPEYYYDTNGNPSRFLEVFISTPRTRRSLRFAVQRFTGNRKWKWVLDFADFVSGKSVNEAQFQATAPLDFRAEITSLLNGYDLRN